MTYTYDTDNNVLRFDVAASADKTPRGAEVKVSSGAKELVLSLSQIEVSLSMIGGNWDMSYYSGAYGQEVSGTGQVGMLSDNLVLLDALKEYPPDRFPKLPVHTPHYNRTCPSCLQSY